MYETILVPLDGSKAAEMVIPYAMEIAARLDSQMILASVCDPSDVKAEQLYQAYLESLSKKVQSQIADWKPRKEKPVEKKIFSGKPAEEILQYADDNDVALIALTSFGASGRSHWFLGNNVARILQSTIKPLLLIRAPANEASLKQNKLFKRILLPLDGSEIGAVAVPYSELLAQALGAELVLFQVVEPLKPPMVGSDVNFPFNAPALDEEKRADSAIYLNGVAERFRKWGFKVSTVVVSGSPANQIIDYAKANAIDLIAMSSHGRTGLGRWVFGSVTDKVLHAGDTPVLVIHPKP